MRSISWSSLFPEVSCEFKEDHKCQRRFYLATLRSLHHCPFFTSLHYFSFTFDLFFLWFFSWDGTSYTLGWTYKLDAERKAKEGHGSGSSSSTNSLTPNFAEGEGPLSKMQRAHSLSPTRPDVVEITDSPDSGSNSSWFILTNDFPFAKFMTRSSWLPPSRSSSVTST